MANGSGDLTAILVFLAKSFTFHDIVESGTWLPLALKDLFLALTGTITATVEQLVNEEG